MKDPDSVIEKDTFNKSILLFSLAVAAAFCFKVCKKYKYELQKNEINPKRYTTTQNFMQNANSLKKFIQKFISKPI
jgi:hypothetical protein